MHRPLATLLVAFLTSQLVIGASSSPSTSAAGATTSSRWTSRQRTYTKPTLTKSRHSTKPSSGTLTSSKATHSTIPGPTCSRAANGTSISVPQSAPSGAPQVPSDFIGFGFETAFVNNYANAFSENLVNSIAKRVGSTLIIRVGGTSGDRVKFDPNQSEDAVCVSGDCPIGSGATYVLGPSYFDGFKSFPNQHFSFQAPMEKNVNTTGSLDYVTHTYHAIGADRVAAIALGNEVDVYDKPYTIQQYVSDAKALEGNITEALGLSPKDRIFEVLDLAGSGTGSFSVQAAFDNGLDSNGVVKYAAQHWYQVPTSLSNYTPETEQTKLMSHHAIVSKFNNGYGAGLQYIQANDPAVSYIISESGSSLIGPPLEFQDAFGAALWVVDFELYAMSQGVKRVDQTGRPAASHSLWVPDTSANDPSNGNQQNIGPQVRGPYYGLPMVADFMGTSSGRVVELLGEDLATAYAIYDPSSGALSKVALVNLKFWSADVGGTRGSMTFDIPVNSSVSSVKVQRLRTAAGAHALGYDNQGKCGNGGMITWAGETWSYKLDNGNGSPVDGVNASETVDVCDGVASVELPDSEAAIVFFP
ncbi:uncharacterized protein LTR77_001380 [Saxophila tyrrhenica]|uniref:Beta-glucuronidase C-terminal domain-containing protein n=1 Tax=Saxophila tyrrhenica TaxID=1690608 RepID=A0AAV9PKM7_9PEZI|nr:hypothetical protein LTR77_001380 [Saxophila tyrrhenica]